MNLGEALKLKDRYLGMSRDNTVKKERAMKNRFIKKLGNL